MTTVEDVQRATTEPGACCFCKQIEPTDELHHSNVLNTDAHTICIAAGLMRGNGVAEQFSREVCP